ncbi:hypothetical protein [Arcicella lustrica]|uniref:RNA helicase n=1 Tax=Arcicella lustrica TaxID=2984196 RepID=A0ABU5SJL5_9BACT|nr:hypothetical protein [Arcicella sp. DC25W]MEA5427497.1 hypothetical protein [Arcicella sp. DC25W]
MSKQSTIEPNKEKEANVSPVLSKKTCGIIMPIADHSDYPMGHWKEVLQIIKDSLSETEFEVKLVSDNIEIGLIHERIVTNIYTNDIVICDVSSKNPNVMFELGMRLAFDKPTIIIKDETTGYSFDTSVIEHLNYQSSLRHYNIESFKVELKKRVIATYKKSIDNNEYSPFLKSFSRTIPLTPSKLTSTELPLNEYIINKIDKLSSKVSRIESSILNRTITKASSFDLFSSKSILNREDFLLFEDYVINKVDKELTISGWEKNEEVLNEILIELNNKSIFLTKEQLISEIRIYNIGRF